MGLLFGGAERRDWTAPPPIPPNSEAGRGFGARGVNLSATEASLQKVAVYAAVRLLREVASTLPLDFFTTSGTQKRQVAPPKWLQDPAGDGYGLNDWLGQLTYCDAMRGNIVARVAHRDNN